MRTSFDNMRRFAQGKPQEEFVGQPTSDPKVLRIESINRDRKGWFAEVRVQNGRAIGRLLSGKKVVRETFDVRIDYQDCFQVDIGTGSGVKVKFHLGSNV